LSLWAVAEIELGKSRDEFGRLTPREFQALVDQRDTVEERLDFRAALIASTIANVNRTKKGKAWKISDFMPKRKRRGRKGKRKQTVREQIALAKAITLAFGGKLLPKRLDQLEKIDRARQFDQSKKR